MGNGKLSYSCKLSAVHVVWFSVPGSEWCSGFWKWARRVGRENRKILIIVPFNNHKGKLPLCCSWGNCICSNIQWGNSQTLAKLVGFILFGAERFCCWWAFQETLNCWNHGADCNITAIQTRPLHFLQVLFNSVYRDFRVSGREP